MNSSELKVCPRCKSEKPIEDFGQRKPNGRVPGWCLICKAAQMRQAKILNPEKFKLRGARFREQHRERLRARDKGYYYRNKSRVWARNIWNNYRLTEEGYFKLLNAQHGKCAICGAKDPQSRFHKFHVDHCHVTKKIRGLLCHTCNLALGYLKDSPQMAMRAAMYLQGL